MGSISFLYERIWSRIINLSVKRDSFYSKLFYIIVNQQKREHLTDDKNTNISLLDVVL